MHGPEGVERFEKKIAANAEDLDQILMERAKERLQKEFEHKAAAIVERTLKLDQEQKAK